MPEVIKPGGALCADIYKTTLLRTLLQTKYWVRPFTRKMDPARQADALLTWYVNTNPHRTPMRANVRACRHLSMGRAWTKSGVFSGGCGAAVRMLPIGLFYCTDPDRLVRAALDECVITHTDPHARAASVAVAYLVGRLIQATPHCSAGDQVLETADRVAPLDADTAAMLRWVTQIVHLTPEEALFEIGTSSDAIEAIPAAVYCLLKHPRNFAHAVQTAVNGGMFKETNFASVAEAMGCFGIRVEKAEDLSAALAQAFNANRPAVIDVVSDYKVLHPRAWAE